MNKALNDEIIEEVHAIKDALAAKCNYDLKLMFEDIKRGEAELRAAGFKFVLPPENPTNLPNTALQRTRFAHR
jgi:hypothetical protein